MRERHMVGWLVGWIGLIFDLSNSFLFMVVSIYFFFHYIHFVPCIYYRMNKCQPLNIDGIHQIVLVQTKMLVFMFAAADKIKLEWKKSLTST